MGMWTRDEEFGRRLDETFDLGEPFIVQAITPDPDPLVLESGESVDRVIVTARKSDPNGKPAGPSMDCKTTANAIVKMAGQVEAGDLPALVELRRVKTRDYDNAALVMRLVRRLT